ncbi:hypothetical protein [Halomonas borealis]|uniref:hypothetical protein n=1 Tax=Halomonas borealis TaxID=2508710 RepID=UPI0010A01BFC|nr:hypothetical protein [Halomonas borealis]
MLFALLPMVGVAYSTPEITDDPGVIYHCRVDGHEVWQRSGCPEGSFVKAYNLEPTEGSRPLPDEPPPTAVASNDRSPPPAAIPRLNVEDGCRGLAAVATGYSPKLFNMCMDQQQAAFDQLKRTYSGFPVPVRSSCLDLARTGVGGSYALLKMCLDQQADAMRNPADFIY